MYSIIMIQQYCNTNISMYSIIMMQQYCNTTTSMNSIFMIQLQYLFLQYYNINGNIDNILTASNRNSI